VSSPDLNHAFELAAEAMTRVVTDVPVASAELVEIHGQAGRARPLATALCTGCVGMDLGKFEAIDVHTWRVPATGRMRVPGIVKASFAMPDALFEAIPAGMGSGEMDAMLTGGARWAVERGYGYQEDLLRIEENGCMAGARPDFVSEKAKQRQRREIGTLGSGNHYLEVQVVTDSYAEDIADAFGLAKGDIVVSIHCSSRRLGQQIGTEFLREMAYAAAAHAIELPDRELVDGLAQRGIIIKRPSLRGVAEEAPGAYKDVSRVVRAADEAGLASMVARLEPRICIKG
jgi:RNA-splicing ligase RtcB